MKFIRNIVTAVCGLLLLSASPMPWSAQPLTVYTVNYPLEYFARRIAGDHAQVVFPAPPDVDPAFWMPDRQILGAYQRADLVIMNGAGYAGWTGKVSLSRARRVDTSSDFSAELIGIEDTVTHRHGPVGDHSHEGTAFTTWLDFSQAVRQAQAVTEALSRKRPDLKNEFGRNFALLRADLMALDQALRDIVADHPEQRLFASHPVYQYLARRYGLDIREMVWEPDRIPDDRQWRQLQSAQAHFPADWMLWEKQPRPEIAGQLERMGIGISVFDPCANRPANGDFLSVMQKNIANLRRAYAR